MTEQQPGAPARKKRKRAKIHHRREMSLSVGKARADINVTPLVDVVLVLLIIFLVITPLLQRGVPIDLPGTVHHTKHQDNGEQLVVSVRADGMYINADKLDEARLRERIEQAMKANATRPVHIRADRSLTYGTVRKVLEIVHSAGASQVGMATQERKEEPAPVKGRQ
jgi:biopolymer transport protein TolR